MRLSSVSPGCAETQYSAALTVNSPQNPSTLPGGQGAIQKEQGSEAFFHGRMLGAMS
jgi:hypothetical protein